MLVKKGYWNRCFFSDSFLFCQKTLQDFDSRKKAYQPTMTNTQVQDEDCLGLESVSEKFGKFGKKGNHGSCKIPKIHHHFHQPNFHHLFFHWPKPLCFHMWRWQSDLQVTQPEILPSWIPTSPWPQLCRPQTVPTQRNPERPMTLNESNLVLRLGWTQLEGKVGSNPFGWLVFSKKTLEARFFFGKHGKAAVFFCLAYMFFFWVAGFLCRVFWFGFSEIGFCYKCVTIFHCHY